jgi:putative FmdB family regulatory protein
MPMYEYQCLKCGLDFEKLVYRQEEKIYCKNCQSDQVERRLSVFSVAGDRTAQPFPDAGPCGSCGAAEQGMCNRKLN